jgi:hypothetical protein
MAKRRPKREKTKVTIDLPARPLAYADAIFQISRHGEKFGESRISQGGVDWWPRDAKKRRKFSWKQLDAALNPEE